MHYHRKQSALHRIHKISLKKGGKKRHSLNPKVFLCALDAK